ncbi:unnamed protein product, partial [Mesorhabditis spiculigera]
MYGPVPLLILTLVRFSYTAEPTAKVFTATGPNGESAQYLLVPDASSPTGSRAIPVGPSGTSLSPTTPIPTTGMPTISLQALMAAIGPQTGNKVQLDLTKLHLHGIDFAVNGTEDASDAKPSEAPSSTLAPYTRRPFAGRTRATVAVPLVENEQELVKMAVPKSSERYRRRKPWKRGHAGTALPIIADNEATTTTPAQPSSTTVPQPTRIEIEPKKRQPDSPQSSPKWRALESGEMTAMGDFLIANGKSKKAGKIHPSLRTTVGPRYETTIVDEVRDDDFTTPAPTTTSYRNRMPVVLEALEPTNNFLDRQVNAIVQQMNSRVYNGTTTAYPITPEDATAESIVQELKNAFFPPQIKASPTEMTALREAARLSTSPTPVHPEIRRTPNRKADSATKPVTTVTPKEKPRADASKTLHIPAKAPKQEEPKKATLSPENALLAFLDRNPLDIYRAQDEETTTEKIVTTTTTAFTTTPKVNITTPALQLDPPVEKQNKALLKVAGLDGGKPSAWKENAVSSKQRHYGMVAAPINLRRLRKKRLRAGRRLTRRDRRRPQQTKRNFRQTAKYQMNDVKTKVFPRKPAATLDGDTDQPNPVLTRPQTQNYQPHPEPRRDLEMTTPHPKIYTTHPYMLTTSYTPIPLLPPTTSGPAKVEPKIRISPELGPKPRLPHNVIGPIPLEQPGKGNKSDNTVFDLFREALEYVLDTKNSKEKSDKPRVQQLKRLDAIPDPNLRWSEGSPAIGGLMALSNILIHPSNRHMAAGQNSGIGFSKLSIKRQEPALKPAKLPQSNLDLEMEELADTISRLDQQQLNSNSIQILNPAEDQPYLIDSRF